MQIYVEIIWIFAEKAVLLHLQRASIYSVKPTLEYIQAHFDAYNQQFFGGQLPPLPIKLSHARGFLGKVTFVRRRHWLFGPFRNEHFVLRINVKIDLPEEVVQDTILHEMIHYSIAIKQIRDTSAHGKLFRAEMARINAEGNRHIRISYRLSPEQIAAISQCK